MENGQDDIEGVRIVRDNETLKGKGIGYLLFKERDCVLKALSKHETIFKKRWTLRVSSCGKRTKRTGGGNGSDDPRGKRPRFKSENPALKRINLKGVDTKKKLLNKRKQSGTHQKNAKKKRTGGGGGKK